MVLEVIQVFSSNQRRLRHETVVVPPDLLFQPFSDQPRRSRGRGRPRRRAPATRTAAGQKDFFDTFLPRLFRAPRGSRCCPN